MVAVRTPMRRFDPRSDVLILVEGELHRERETLHAALRDVSDHGMKLAVDKHLEVGERVRVTLQRPSAITLTAKVRWCHATDGADAYHAGLLVEGDLDVLVELQRYLAKV
jgi:hypothetical protein